MSNLDYYPICTKCLIHKRPKNFYDKKLNKYDDICRNCIKNKESKYKMHCQTKFDDDIYLGNCNFCHQEHCLLCSKSGLCTKCSNNVIFFNFDKKTKCIICNCVHTYNLFGYNSYIDDFVEEVRYNNCDLDITGKILSNILPNELVNEILQFLDYRYSCCYCHKKIDYDRDASCIDCLKPFHIDYCGNTNYIDNSCFNCRS